MSEASRLPDLDDPELAPFWEGCRVSELRIPRCAACGKYVWYPRRTCPVCGDGDLRWTAVRGRGRLFTWVRVHRAFRAELEARIPFLTALVELEEDTAVRLATLLEPPPVDLRLGLPVEVFFERVDDRLTLPRFRIPPLGETR